MSRSFTSAPRAGFPATRPIAARRRPCNDSRCGDDLADPWYVVPMFLGLPSPRLPARASALNSIPLAVAAAVHLLTVIAILLIVPPPARRMTHDEPIPAHPMPIVLPPNLLWRTGTAAGGGGGGGNHQSAPIRHAESVGHDAATLRTTPPRRQVPGSVVEDAPPSLLLD